MSAIEIGFLITSMHHVKIKSSSSSFKLFSSLKKGKKGHAQLYFSHCLVFPICSHWPSCSGHLQKCQLFSTLWEGMASPTHNWGSWNKKCHLTALAEKSTLFPWIYLFCASFLPLLNGSRNASLPCLFKTNTGRMEVRWSPYCLNTKNCFLNEKKNQAKWLKGMQIMLWCMGPKCVASEW